MAKTTGSCFVQGDAGHRYVRKHIQYLVAHGIVGAEKNTSKDKVEGGDSRIVYHRFGKEVDMDELSMDGFIDVSGKGYEIVRIETGGVEVKTISNFTFRTNDMNEQSGTLPFELWRSDRRELGWLPALIHPELRLKTEEEQPIHATQPVLFSFLLVSYLGPYTCIMFEDFPALVQRLEELAAEKGFQLAPYSEECPKGIPVGDVTWRQDDPYIIDNCWHVPFDRLSDLATVTLIGRKPMVKRSTQLNDNDDYVRLQESRYNLLAQCSSGRTIVEDDESRADFYPADETHLYADILNNIEIIEHLDPNEYPFLCQALKSRDMRRHLNSILYNMYSQLMISRPKPRMKQKWFLQAKNYLRDWSRECGITGSSFSGQSHIKFMTDADLLEKYVDNSKPTNQKVYRSVHPYTKEVLHTADQKAKAYLDAGINLNKFQKSEVIKVSGQKRADHLYFGDGRIISKMQDEVDKAFFDAANRLLNEKKKVLPDEIESIVTEEINRKYWVDPFDESIDSEQEKQYRQASQEINRLKNRYLELSKEVPCQFRELTSEEKEDLHLPPRSRKKYFIR